MGQLRLTLPDFNMYERAMFTYLKLLYKFRSNPSVETLAPCENCLEAFKTLGCFGVANQESRLLENYRKESHI
ncbi:MAG: hypothetical protein LBI13_04360 [Streptococcaceae bacterium]|jgi:hypothetical protein|nr:hypothetical protein [Streptococcaceae bacterium]